MSNPRLSPVFRLDRVDGKRTQMRLGIGALIPYVSLGGFALLTEAPKTVAGELRTNTIRVEEMAQPDARAPGDGPDSDLVETGKHRLLSVIDWGGRRFLQYEFRTFWTVDSGRNWKSRGWIDNGPKGPVPWLTQGRFLTTGAALFLTGGTGTAAIAAFDPAKDDWVLTDFGHGFQDGITAMGCDAGAIYLYDALRNLTVSRDNGVTWDLVAGVPPPPGGYFYEGLEAEGLRLLLRFREPSGISTDAGSSDGGKTWKHFPPGADVRLKEGCFHWIAGDSLRSECAPGAPDRTAAVSFGTLVRLFRQPEGGLFALADSGVFHFQPLDTADPQAAAGWEPVGPAPAWKGWIMAGEILSRQTVDKVAWVSPGNPIAVSLAPRSRARYGSGNAVRSGPVPIPEWLTRGRRPDGRSVRLHP